MRNLEFDPYLCEVSGLKQLTQALKKFKKTLLRLNFIIRRVKAEDEIQYFGALLPKLRSLVNLRIEFPKTQGISVNGIKTLIKSCRKCDLLKSLEVHLIGLSLLPRNFRNFGGVFERLQKLENVKYHIQASHAPASMQTEEELKQVSKHRKVSNLKSFSLKLGVKSGWYCPEF